MAHINALDRASIQPISSQEVHPSVVQHLNEMDGRIQAGKRIAGDIFDQDASALKRRKPLPLPSINETEDPAFWQAASHKSTSERLLDISLIVSDIIGGHIHRKKDQEWEKQQKMDANIADQKTWKNWQALAKAAGGFGSALLSIAGAGVGGPIGEALTGISRMTPTMSDTASTLLSKYELELSHKQQEYLADRQKDSTREQQEAIKQFRQLLQQVVQLALDAKKER